MKAIITALGALVLWAGAHAQEVKALVGGMLVDGFSPEPIQDSVVLIEGNRITAVGTVDSLPVPEGAEVISTEGMTVLPGLVDAHVHLMINGHADYAYWHPEYADRMADVIMPASARQLLMAGVTSAHDVGSTLDDILTVRRRIDGGDIPGPRLFVTGPFIQKAPYADWNEDYRWGVDGAADAKRKVRRLAEAGVDFIKLIDQDEMTEAEARAVVEEAHARGLKVIAHGHRPEEVLVGLKIGADRFEHTGQGPAPAFSEEVMTALKERTANMAAGPLYWTPTISGLWNYPYLQANPEALDDPSWREGLPDAVADDIAASIRNPERLPYYQIVPDRFPTLKTKFDQLKKAGLKLLIGTDSGIPLFFHSQSTWNEIEIWVNELGVAPMEAIRAATYWPAVFVGQGDQLGAIAPGYLADIIAVKGDALRHPALLSRVDIVVKDGVRFK